MQRRAPLVGAVHPAREIRGRRRDQRADRIDLADGDGRKNVMAGAVREQVVDQLAVGLDIVPAARPADHLELVPVAGADRIGAVLDQQADHREVLPLRRKVQRHGVVALVADVGVGAVLEQRADHGLVIDAEVQRGAKAGVTAEMAALLISSGWRSINSTTRAASPVSAAPNKSVSGSPAAARACFLSAGQLSAPCSRASACCTSRRPGLAGPCGCALPIARQRFAVVRAQRPQPSLGGLPQVVEGAHRHLPSVDA